MNASHVSRRCVASYAGTARDRYTVTVPDQRLDFLVAAAMAVALDALQSR